LDEENSFYFTCSTKCKETRRGGKDDFVLIDLYPDYSFLDSLRSHFSKRFEETDARGGGEIKTALAVGLGNANGAVGVVIQQIGGEAVGFVSEDEGVAVREIGLPQISAGFAGEKPESPFLRGAEEAVGVVVQCEFQAGPIVHGAAADLAIGKEKTERANQMQLGAGGDAEPGDIAGVGRDLGLQERDAEPMRRK
jgi:hypothetical protein